MTWQLLFRIIIDVKFHEQKQVICKTASQRAGVGVSPVCTLPDEWVCEKHGERSILSSHRRGSSVIRRGYIRRDRRICYEGGILKMLLKLGGNT